MPGSRPQVCISRSEYSDPDMASLLAPLGGMKAFVSRGERVLLKVNLLSGRDPEKAVTTHPAIVSAVAREVRGAGGVPYIGDSPSGRFSKRALEKAYERSGLKKMAEEDGIELSYDTTSRKRAIPGARRLNAAKVCDFYLNADKVVALPKLKTHFYQIMTLATKIMYGVVPGLTKAQYHAVYPNREAFADMLLDLLSIAGADLFIMDGVVGMEGDGPGSGKPVKLGVTMASVDPFAMDLAVCEMLNVEPAQVPTLKRAKLRGLWPDGIEYPLLSPGDVRYEGFRLPPSAEKKKGKRSPVILEGCTGCGKCAEICPKDAISIHSKRASVEHGKCIRCYCCHEVCPENAIALRVLKK